MVKNYSKKIIGISSGKGGVGKTTFSINLSSALYKLGVPNVIVDGDISNANLSVQLGFKHNIPTIQDLMEENLNPRYAIRIHSTGLRILPAAISLDRGDVDLKRIKKYLIPLQETLIIDFPPGVAKNTVDLMRACDELIILTTPEVASLTDSLKTLDLARKYKKPIKGIVVNRAVKDKYELSIDELQIMCETKLLGVIPEDKNVRRANFECMPYVFRYPNSRAAIETMRIASGLLSKPYCEPKLNFLKSFFN
ncbi:MAG: P-loop NTPase [Candidatus Aenigmarchaeota archaeon]|nr:P-loop NTPase [Candidatus Aenigmarchaeota archaeon]